MLHLNAPLARGASRRESQYLLHSSRLIGVESVRTTQETTGGIMQVHYLEVVTADVGGACEKYSAATGVAFGKADPGLGGARTAPMADGGIMGIRAPMHDGEKAVTRAYLQVDDIAAAVDAVENAGGMIAVPPMDIPNHGKCAIFMMDGIEAGLWEVL